MDLSSAHPNVHQLNPSRPYPRLLAEFSTKPGAGEPSAGRWTQLRITQIGPSEYCCEKTRGPAPLEESSLTVSSLASARGFFGEGWVVRELFAILDPKRFPRWP